MVAHINGELIVWDAGRLAFERLQNRLHRRGAGAAQAAVQWPAHFVAFDVTRLSGTDTTAWPYSRRRAALEQLFAERQLAAPWALCLSTTDPATVREWLTWAEVGMEGLVWPGFKADHLTTPFRHYGHQGRRGRRPLGTDQRPRCTSAFVLPS
ncbi:hypothetical protein [Streptomyces sp. NPDC051218]|uniref:ATP-dependent DNA ligase n=1 Tax=Streptomyces sp. NPDC051218 TaxID=3365645 RepID=UPI0037B79E7D